MLIDHRVRREELYSASPSPSSSPDAALGQAFLKSLGEKFTETASPHVIEDERQQSEELEFRLFARPSTNDDKTITRIRVASPSLDDGHAGLVNPERPREYYFRDSLSPKAKGRLKIAAVSGEDVLARSCTKWPGCSLPWRVTMIPAIGKLVQTADQTDATKKKTRKGKKTRIATRKKAVEDRERKEKEQEGAAEKELAERAKRAKRNREKKLKKRERDKATKAAARAAGENVAESSDDDPSE